MVFSLLSVPRRPFFLFCGIMCLLVFSACWGLVLSNDLIAYNDATTEQVTKLFEAVSEGMFLPRACAYAGIDYSVVTRWIRNARADAAAGLMTSPAVLITRRLMEAMTTAELEALKHVRKGGHGWQGSAWFLERRFSSTWDLQGRVPVDAQTQEREQDRIRMAIQDVVESIPQLSSEQREAIELNVARSMEELSAPDPVG